MGNWQGKNIPEVSKDDKVRDQTHVTQEWKEIEPNYKVKDLEICLPGPKDDSKVL